jgi:hypothetical protein
MNNQTKKSPVYTDALNRFRQASRILNRDFIPDLHSVIEDRQNLEGLLLERQGEGGVYFRGKEQRTAYLPAIRAKIRDVEVQFKRVQEQLIKSGYEKLEEMPIELQNEKLKLLAEETICLEEIDLLEQKIKIFADSEQHIDDGHVLEFGLKCSGHFWGSKTSNWEMKNQLHDLDGQLISMHKQGFLIIDDKRSPYNGLKVSDYHKLAKQWTMDRLIADKERLKRLQAEAKAEGKPVPSMLPLHGTKRVDKNSLPAWPEGAVNYKVQEAVKK